MLKFPRHKVIRPDGKIQHYALGGLSIHADFLGNASTMMAGQLPLIFVVPHLTYTVLKKVYGRNLHRRVTMRREKIGRERIAGGEVRSREVPVADLEYSLIGDTEFGQNALQLKGPVCFSDGLVNELTMLLRDEDQHEGIDDATQAHGIVGRDHLFRSGLELIEEDPSGWYAVVREC
jgi:hypothetical protein